MSITETNGLKINTKLLDFVNNEIIPDTNIKSEEFWNNFGQCLSSDQITRTAHTVGFL